MGAAWIVGCTGAILLAMQHAVQNQVPLQPDATSDLYRCSFRTSLWIVARVSAIVVLLWDTTPWEWGDPSVKVGKNKAAATRSPWLDGISEVLRWPSDAATAVVATILVTWPGRCPIQQVIEMTCGSETATATWALGIWW